MSDRSILLCAIADITDADYGEPLKAVLPKLKLRAGVSVRQAQGALWNEPHHRGAAGRIYRMAAERAADKLALAEALSASGAVGREAVAKLRLRLGQYAVRARALGALVG